MASASVRTILVAIVAIASIVLTLIALIADVALGLPSDGVYAVFAPVVFVFTAVGWLLCVRRPENVIGPLCLAFGLVFAVYFPIDLLVRLGHTGTLLSAAATLSSSSDAPAFIALAMILILFPDGRLPGPRWRWTVAVATVGTVAAVVGFSLAAGPLPAFPTVVNPIGVPWIPGALIGEIGYVALISLLVAAVMSLVVRWRRGTVTERAQLKWVAAASVSLLVAEGFNLATFDPSDPLGTPVAVILASVATALVPAAIGVAILRYRLYEIDRIVSRTIGWALVTGILATVFVTLVVGLQAGLSAVVPSESTLAVAVSTLVAFALFQPVRRRVQRAVDRRFDRARYDGERTAAAFHERMRGEVELAGIERELRTATVAALSPSTLGLWLRRHSQ